MNILIRLLIHTTSGSDVNETSHPVRRGPLDVGGHFRESVRSLPLVTRGRGHPGDLEDPPTFLTPSKSRGTPPPTVIEQVCADRAEYETPPESCTVASAG